MTIGVEPAHEPDPLLTGEGPDATVMALVLTFNDPDSLRRCLTAIDAQRPPPSEIVVVDNAGEAPAVVLVDGLGLRTPWRVLRMPSNTGPAGGHAAGLAHFLDSDAALAWVMDDDCEPTPGCLRALLEVSVNSPASCDPVYPQWFNTVRQEITNYPAWCGFLIRRSTVEQVGLPRADLFWWMEDTEYLHWRIPEAGFSSARVATAVVDHHQARRGEAKAAWKYYYEARNSVYFRLHVQRHRGRRFYRLARALLGLSWGLAREPERPRKAWLVARGVVDGLLGRLGTRAGLPPTGRLP